jgi:hypothetical protein
VGIWPENEAAVTLFCQLGTQWRIGMGGPIGLDYGPVFALMNRMDLTRAQYDQLFSDIRELEQSALTTMNSKE